MAQVAHAASPRRRRATAEGQREGEAEGNQHRRPGGQLLAGDEGADQADLSIDDVVVGLGHRVGQLLGGLPDDPAQRGVAADEQRDPDHAGGDPGRVGARPGREGDEQEGGEIPGGSPEALGRRPAAVGEHPAQREGRVQPEHHDPRPQPDGPVPDLEEVGPHGAQPQAGEQRVRHGGGGEGQVGLRAPEGAGGREDRDHRGHGVAGRDDGRDEHARHHERDDRGDRHQDGGEHGPGEDRRPARRQAPRGVAGMAAEEQGQRRHER